MEARSRLEREGFKVFAITPPKSEVLLRLRNKAALAGARASRQTIFSSSISNSRRCFARGHSYSSGHHDVAPALRVRATAGGIEEVEEAIRGGSALSTLSRPRATSFAHLHSFDPGRRAIRGAGRSALALCDLHATFGRVAAKKSAARSPIPRFLLLASLGMVIFLTVYVVPRMSELFAGFGGKLPW